MRVSALLQFVIASTVLVAAHPGEFHEDIDDHELARRHVAAEERHVAARSCASVISRQMHARKIKRSALMKRASSTETAAAPHYSTIQNFTCVTAPEVTEGPYYINNEIVRTDLSETQGGVPLVLDIGIINTDDCTPLSNAFVELWMANATGVYGGYPAQLGGAVTKRSASDTAAHGLLARQGPGGGGGGGSQPLVRNETFLRGGYYTNDEGIVEISMIYTGFYQGRAPHIHTMVHLDWQEADNGTLISHSGTLQHIGQFFFDESWNDKVFALSPYTTNTNSRTLNSQDSILKQANSSGNNAFIQLEQIGASLQEGLLGYVNLGVSASASYTINNKNYYNSTG